MRARACDDCGERPWSAISFTSGRRRCFGCWIVYWGRVSAILVAVAMLSGVRMVPVPDIVGLPIVRAKIAIAGATLELNRVVERASAAARFEVLEQEPAAGKLTPRGSPVNLVVSSGSLQGR